MTSKAHFLMVYIRINNFRLPIVLPAFVLNSLISELCDLVNFFTFFSSKVTAGIDIVENAVYTVTDFKKYDFVNISTASAENNDVFKIRICTR